MGESISEVFGMSDKNLEIGYTQITKYGIITHIIHYVYSMDLEELEEQLQEDENVNVSIAPSFFTQQLYGTYSKEINQIFRRHYGVSSEFKVIYHKRYPKSDKSMMGQTQTHIAAASAEISEDGRDRDDKMDERRASVMQNMLKKMKTNNNLPRLDVIMGGDDDDEDEENVE